MVPSPSGSGSIAIRSATRALADANAAGRFGRHPQRYRLGDFPEAGPDFLAPHLAPPDAMLPRPLLRLDSGDDALEPGLSHGPASRRNRPQPPR